MAGGFQGMANTYFQFKRFTIHQDRCAMKVGTDGVLLGAWTDALGARSILDVGTGTGLIALMLAQRSEARITALEIDKEAAAQAQENFTRSPWNDRMEVHKLSFQDYIGQTGKKFDCIVCNPPFFRNSFQPLLNERLMARHAIRLTIEELIAGAGRLLTPEGTISFIYPYDQLASVEDVLLSNKLFSRRITSVRPHSQKPYHRFMIQAGTTQPTHLKTNELVLWDQKASFLSEDYIKLTREFYLKL